MEGKIYCFQYDITNNLAFRQEYDYYSINNDSEYVYFELEDDRTICLNRVDVEVDNEIDVVNIEGRKVIWLYTFIDDINRALDVLYRKIESEREKVKAEIEAKQRNYATLSDILVTFEEKKNTIKEKYPNGVKESK